MASGKDSSSFERIGVVGAGTMGGGIAQTFASFGSTVQLVDVDEGASSAASARSRRASRASSRRRS